jgi:carboxypeptidase D
MQLLSLLAVGGLTAAVQARSARSVGKKVELPRPRSALPVQNLQPHKRQSSNIITTEASKGTFFYMNHAQCDMN